MIFLDFLICHELSIGSVWSCVIHWAGLEFNVIEMSMYVASKTKLGLWQFLWVHRGALRLSDCTSNWIVVSILDLPWCTPWQFSFSFTLKLFSFAYYFILFLFFHNHFIFFFFSFASSRICLVFLYFVDRWRFTLTSAFILFCFLVLAGRLCLLFLFLPCVTARLQLFYFMVWKGVPPNIYSRT